MSLKKEDKKGLITILAIFIVIFSVVVLAATDGYKKGYNAAKKEIHEDKDTASTHQRNRIQSFSPLD